MNDLPDQELLDADAEDILVTSPTSLALRDSLRRRSSSSGHEMATYAAQAATAAPPPLRATMSGGFGDRERSTGRTGRHSFFSRAPPPAPPAHPPQVSPAMGSSRGSISHSPYASGSANGGSMPRASSNPSLAGMNEEEADAYAYPASSHGYSMGPNSGPPSNSNGGGSSSRASFMSRRGGTRKSILSVLTREKETPMAIPEGEPPEITCEGFLTKRGHVFTNWKMRYFVLRGNILEYFSGEDKMKRYGSVVVEKVAAWTGESHGFMFLTTKQVPYYVYASSENERARWMRAMKEYLEEPAEVTCEGFLTRRGHLVPSQRFAYYVLNGTSLRHYADQKDYRENQSAIAEVEIRSVAPWDGDRLGLMFQTVTGSVFYTVADSVSEQQKWVASVKKATANIPDPISCAGYLTKQGHKRKSWKKRYFTLRGSVVAYYTDYDMANSAKGKALAEVVVEDVQRWDGEPFGFMFTTSEQVPYYVYADNERERTKWMTALRKLTAFTEEPEVEKKRCPDCNAVLTGSRFCGACGHNLRGTTLADRSAPGARNTAMNGDELDGDQDDGDLDDENTAFDELEALSEGARTLLLAVMQTPEGIDVGGETGLPTRITNVGNMKSSNLLDEYNDDDDDDSAEAQRQLEVDVAQILEDADRIEDADPIVSPVAQPETQPQPLQISAIEIPAQSENESDGSDSPVPASPPRSPSPKAVRRSPAKAPEPASKLKFTPNFAVVENSEVKNSSFTSFGESDEEEKTDPKPVPVPVTSGKGSRKTTGMLMMEDSSDEDDTVLPTKPPAAEYGKEDQEEKEDDDTWAPADGKSTDHPRRKSSADSLELDTRGIVGLDESAKPTKQITRSSSRLSERSSKNDLYHFIEKELDFTPLFVPSADSPVRCRLYSSMAYTSAKKVILFLSDSGPLGLWRQDPTDQATTVNHKWSMVRYLSRAQEEGFGIILCNPFSNSAVVYEAGGFERTVPVPNSSTPPDHVQFVWDNYVVKCKGQVSVVAFARGGALMKSIIETDEESAREKIHRIAFVESKHEIDGNESAGVLDLLGRRSINWEASFELQGGQVADSQARVGCVCLSIGYMPPNSLEPEGSPTTLEKSEDPVFAFINANPERPGMTAIVKWVRAELRKRRQAPSSSRARRNSNILVLGEADAQADETSDHSSGDDGRRPNGAAGTGEQNTLAATAAATAAAPKPSYYLPKPSAKPKSPPPPARNGAGADKRDQISVARDFELLQVVGQGGFGKVFLTRKRTPPFQGECYAMKVLKKQHVISSGLVNTTMAERKILIEIRHPFVVQLHYAFQDASKLYLVMDYLSGGALAAHLRRRRKFPEDWARFYAAEVAAAMAHLHSVNIIYRDAKLENVLLDHEGHVRITDFGLSKVGVSDLKGAKTFCGTAAYIAPELLKGHSYGKAADWWSFGILLYEMIGGKPPYYHRNRDIMFQTILKQEWVTFSPSFSDAAVDLIRGLLTRDPTMRLGSGPRGADEVLTHPFFDSISWPDLLEKRIPPPFNPGVGKLDTHYAPRLNNNEITTRDRQGSVLTANRPHNNDFDGFSFVGRPSSMGTDDLE